jgi:CHAT domain-containing protein/cytochrome c-type biogenesis protein CcmH/NrfG
LLGEIYLEQEKVEIEERLMTDEKYFQELLIEEEELIQDYVDEELTVAERENFEKNFLITEERGKSINFARTLRKYVSRQQSGKESTERPLKDKKSIRSFLSGLFSRPVPIAAATLVIIALSSLLIWNFYYRTSLTERTLASLNKAYQHERPLESRITGFSYAPFTEVRTGKTERVDLPERNRVELDLLNNASGNPSAESLHLLARLYLAKRDFDAALKELEEANRLAPQNAAILSDIGTVYLEKSKTATEKDNGKSLEQAGRALNYYERAIEIDPNLLEARFNKAISLQILRSLSEARLAWQEYLNLDADSQWALEARRNLELLDLNKSQNKNREEILDEFFTAYQERNDQKAYQIISRNREMITGKLVPEQLAFLFIEAKSNNNKIQSQYYFDALKYAGKLEEKNSGDLYFSDLLKYYDSTSAAEITAIKQAQDSVKKGYQFCREGNYRAAIKEFEFAQNLFTEIGDFGEANYSSFWVGYLLNRQNQLQESTARFEYLAEYCRSKNYKLILSHTLSWLAINAGSSNRYSEEIEFNKKALQIAEEISDLYNQQKILSQLSDNLSRLGQYRQALEFGQKTLQIAALPEASLRQKSRDYNTLARIFYRMQLYAAASAYKKESVNILSQEGDKNNFNQTAYADLGLIYGTQGKYQEADKYFTEAFRLAESISDAKSKEKSTAYTKLQLAQIQRKALDCEKALGNYNDAVEFYNSSEFKFYEYEARKGRLLCNLAEKNETAFNEELPVILNLFREFRSTILEEESRNNFFAAEQDVYDIVIDYEFSKGNYEKAFDYSEESRSRSLLDLINSGVKASDNQLNPESEPETKIALSGQEPLKLADLQAQIPEQVQLVQYSVLDDKVLIWLITKNTFNAYKADISSAELASEAITYLKLISREEPSNPDKEKELAIKLYDLLFGQIENQLDSGKKIGLIPDKVLFRLPFATLISARDEKFFISKYTFFVAPSVNVFLACTQKSTEKTGEQAESLLSIGNPSFDRQKFTNLADLPSAKTEAEAIRDFYGEAVLLLTDKDATKEKIKENLTKSNVIHFAGHYIVDEYAPQFSKLILAKDKQINKLQDSETLMNYEIIGERFTNTRLIVLAACQTGIESFHNGEGMIGASRTFLATGVPLVVASQWNVDSKATTRLMKQFHYYRKREKLSTVDALRRAQMDMLETGTGTYGHPYYWAAFITLGGYSEF